MEVLEVGAAHVLLVCSAVGEEGCIELLAAFKFENLDLIFAAAPERTPARVRPTVARLPLPEFKLPPPNPPSDDIDVDKCSEN